MYICMGVNEMIISILLKTEKKINKNNEEITIN